MYETSVYQLLSCIVFRYEESFIKLIVGSADMNIGFHSSAYGTKSKTKMKIPKGNGINSLVGKCLWVYAVVFWDLYFVWATFTISGEWKLKIDFVMF